MSFFESSETIALIIVLLPLTGAIISGLFGQAIGRKGAHCVTIGLLSLATLLSFMLFDRIIIEKQGDLDTTLYYWINSGSLSFQIGFLLDSLSVSMMVVVTFVSLMVHIYTIGYMHEDPGYQRFFSYISLFTFAMLMLVMSNNFVQLFFGWEAVGLVSYLLIGFWFHKDTAIFANLKAFLVNRVGDFGFLLGIAAVYMYFNSLDYAVVFEKAPYLSHASINIPGFEPWSVMTVIAICLFIGAMGKSAQVPLHVWLPDSMEGPTPISALIHAATMVTAGIFMVTRMSPIFEYSEVALNMILLIGSITALFMGFLGIVQHDIKRVIAYSTLSQLGYMTVALGASAYNAAMFHLITHAFFKALLFLAAGSVIIGMHHIQDMRKMGGLYRYMPITWICSLVGTLALIGFPGTSGFFSKDAIIEAVHLSELAFADFAYYALLIGVVITALYSFRLFFLVFHGEERMDKSTWEHLHESPAVVYVPLILLAIPSVLLGYFLIEDMLFGDYFSSSVFILEQHNVLAQLAENFHGPFAFILHAFSHPLVLSLVAAGFLLAWFCYSKNPQLPEQIQSKLSLLHKVLIQNYGFDKFNQKFFAGGSRKLGDLLWRYGDIKIIDGVFVNGTALGIGWLSSVIRHIQSGFLYHYAFVMILGMVVMLVLFVPGVV